MKMLSLDVLEHLIRKLYRVLNYYAVQGRVKQIDADASAEEVVAAGMSALSASTVLAVGGPSKSKQCKSYSCRI